MKNKIRMIIDISMTVLLPLLMAYSLIGEAFHEIAGTAIFVLFVLHHILNRKWYGALFKGKYNARRGFQIVLDMLLLIFMILQPVSGIMMSKHLYTFLPVFSGSSQARSIHMLLAYWGYVLLNIHAGTHLTAPMRELHGKNKKIYAVVCAAWGCVSIYGCIAFMRRGFPGYMSGKMAFAFFDYSEPRVFFFVDYIKEDWLIIPDCNVPLISQETYEKAQSAIAVGKSYTQRKLDYPLRSLLRCGECERAMVRHSKAKRIYYQCEASRYSAETTCPLGERFYEDELEKAVIGSLRQMLELLVDHDKKIQEAAAKTKGSMDNMKQTVLRLESKMKRNQSERLGAYERYSYGRISRDEYLAVRDKLTEENAQMQAKLTELQEGIAVLEAKTDPEMELYGSEARNLLKSENVTNEMLLFFISRVKVFSSMRIEIEYRFSDELMTELGGGENG